MASIKKLAVAGVFSITFLGAASFSGAGESPAGKTTVEKFRDGKQCAFTLQFDDSIPSQADFAIPHMNARGLRGSFYVNPDTGRYKMRRRNWTKVCPLWDQELANHTLLHEGAKDYTEAVHQIGDCSKLIWSLYPGKSHLVGFARGGGTTWGITDAQIEGIMKRFHCVHRTGDSIATERDHTEGESHTTTADILAYVDRAVSKKDWVPVFFHGVGPRWEWLGTNGSAFDALLDKLVKLKDKVWVGPWAEVYRYTQERDDARVKVLSSKKNGIKLSLSTPHLDKKLFIEPLTLTTEVPADWEFVSVKQGGKALAARKSVGKDGKATVQYDASPNKGEVVLARVKKEPLIVSKRPNVEKIRKHVDNKLLAGMSPSSLIDLEDGVRAFVFKGNGKAVAALWYEGPKEIKWLTFFDRSNKEISFSEVNRWKEGDIRVKFINPETLKVVRPDGEEIKFDMVTPEANKKSSHSLKYSPWPLKSDPIYLIGKNAQDLEDLILYGNSEKWSWER